MNRNSDLASSLVGIVNICHYFCIYFRKRTRIQHIMTEGNRKSQVTTETRRADVGMERRSITEAGSAPTSTSAGNKKPVAKTRARNRSGTRRRTRPGAERRTERDATRGTKTRRETERETASLTEIRKETKTGKKTEAKSARRKENATKTKRGIRLGRVVTLRFVILINVGRNHKSFTLLMPPSVKLHRHQACRSSPAVRHQK